MSVAFFVDLRRKTIRHPNHSISAHVRAIEVIKCLFERSVSDYKSLKSDEGNPAMTAYDDQNIFAKILRGEIPSFKVYEDDDTCLLYTSPSPRDQRGSRMPSSA